LLVPIIHFPNPIRISQRPSPCICDLDPGDFERRPAAFAKLPGIHHVGEEEIAG